MKSISYGTIFGIAFPVAVSQSAARIIGMTDLSFVAPLGVDAVASLSLASMLWAAIFTFLEGFRTGTTLLTAEAFGAGREDRAAAVLRTGVAGALLFGGAIAALAGPISRALFAFPGAERIAVCGIEYMTISLRAAPATLLFFVGVGAFRGAADTRTPLYAGILVCVVNASLDAALVPGRMGFPSLGAAGAAWASLVAYCLGAGALVFLQLGKHRQGCVSRDIVLRFVKTSVDVGIFSGAISLALFIFVLMIRTLGGEALAVHHVCFQVFLCTYLPASGFQVAASVLVSGFRSAGEHALARMAAMRVVRVASLFSALVGVGMWFGARSIAAFFSPSDPIVVARAAETLRFMCVAQMFSVMYMTLQGSLLGYSDTRFLAFEGLVSGYGVFLPCAWFLMLRRGGGVGAGYVAFLVWTAFDFVCLLARWTYIGKRMSKNRSHS